ncbi:uncharacterized protein LOC115883426 [Sitophilus oryzae]|uniref:Uncharacterized protein LOC115883426 n=1 Tax=Sitophilus oryzae TaxID=7048 RepID=A0A6J2Y3Y9_SITOR|nr:uncharacterized protein LOC115883426 [Sitophilus oryzae]
MIFKVVLLAGLVTVAYSISSKGLASLSSQNRPTYARILSQSQDTNPDGSYHYSFETENGINQQQSGEPRQIGKEVGVVVQGSASWTDSEGNGHQLNYVADENGYQPQSPDIPVPPAVPEQIARALEWIRSHPEKPEKQLTSARGDVKSFLTDVDVRALKLNLGKLPKLAVMDLGSNVPSRSDCASCVLCRDIRRYSLLLFIGAMKVLIILAVALTACLAQRRNSIQVDQYQDNQPAESANQQYQAPEQQYQNQDARSKSREITTPIPIIRYDKEQGDDGSYKAAWETGNNILAQEEGFLKPLGPDPDEEGGILNAQVQQGSYSYTAPDGQIITVNYIADEKGFHPTGDHLPTPPPVSAEVQKGLDLIFAGIKAQQEADEREARENPQGKRPQEEEKPNYNGQYRQ